MVYIDVTDKKTEICRNVDDFVFVIHRLRNREKKVFHVDVTNCGVCGVYIG